MHLLIAIPAAVVFTVFYELAHCTAVWMQGGTVTDFVWIPSGEEWGHMQYIFPKGTNYSSAIISTAPYILWITLCIIAGIFSLKRKPWKFLWASTIFIWLFVVPIADIANAAIPYIVRNANNDLKQAFGSIQSSYIVVGCIFGIIAVIYGLLLNKRLYRNNALSVAAYSILVAIAAIAISLLTC
jgi:hypothetical protein